VRPSVDREFAGKNEARTAAKRPSLTRGLMVAKQRETARCCEKLDGPKDGWISFSAKKVRECRDLPPGIEENENYTERLGFSWSAAALAAAGFPAFGSMQLLILCSS